MKGRIRRIDAYSILSSGGGPAAEAEVTLQNGCVGRGSAPVAIKPGELECRRSSGIQVGAPVPDFIATQLDELANSAHSDQSCVDDWLAQRVATLGTDVSVAVSLAYARAAAQSLGVALTEYIATLAGTRPSFPGLLIAAVSGGIHGGSGLPYQQIMLSTEPGQPSHIIPQVLDVYRRLESELFETGRAIGYSASSGIVVRESDEAIAFDVTQRAISDSGLASSVKIAIDVAAEHMRQGNGYKVEGQSIDAHQLSERLLNLADRYPIVMVEDPFAPAHRDAWRKFTDRTRGRVTVVGDDLFASRAPYLDPTLAGGVLLKINQVGTLSDTIETAKRALDEGMVCAVSHRSLETEDTAVCDLAVALGARWVKVGGPRRGDRVAKYNQLMRLERGARMGA